MKTTFLFVTFLFFANFSTADTTVVDQQINTMPFSTVDQFEINSAEETKAAEFEILIKNGDGLDYFPQPCNGGSTGERMKCKAHNLLTAAQARTDRPADLEVRLNGAIVVSRENFPKEKGQFFYRANLSGRQLLEVYQSGLPMTSTTIKVVKLADRNASPIAGFTFNSSNNFLEPSMVGFSGLNSIDPDGVLVSYIWDFGDGSYGEGSLVNHFYEFAGQYSVTLTVTDDKGAQSSRVENILIHSDTTPPVLSNLLPPTGTEITGTSISLSGQSNEQLSKVEIEIDGGPPVLGTIDPDDSFKFFKSISFTGGGLKNILVRAYDYKNNYSSVQLSYNLNFNNPPVPKINLLSQSDDFAPSMIWLDASASTDADGEALSYEWDFDDGSEFSTELKPSHLFKESGIYTVRLKVTDARGLSATVTKSITLNSVSLPIDPAQIAPPIEQNIYQSGAEKYGFLYTDPQGPQKNVDETKMVAALVIPLTGRVLKNENEPLPAVKVTVVGHPEFGYTYTREDGRWDIAVNGGSDIEVLFEKTGYSRAIRTLDTEKLVAPVMDDVVLSEIDQKSTKVSLNSEVVQTHEASVVQDESGERKTQILIPENTSAQLRMPDGSLRSVSSLTIRATELTVGNSGPQRMPGPLPPRSAYTYCASFTADEAIAVGAESIEFSKPVPVYLDNYLNIPTGMAVPVGFFNPKTANWEAINDGVVIKVLGVQDSKAQLDMTGSGSIASASTLNAWGVTENELAVLAQKFQVGQSFWRVRVKHFSEFDLNFAAGQIIAGQNDIIPIPSTGNGSGGGPGNDGSTSPGCSMTSSLNPAARTVHGCEIDPRQQTIAEKIALPGLDFNLHYTSARSAGFKGASSIRGGVFNSLSLGGRPILRAQVTVDIAGKRTVFDYNQPSLDASFDFNWDGRDGNNQLLGNSAEATVTITYFVRNQYMLFGASASGMNFNMAASGISGTVIEGRGEYAIAKSFKLNVNSPAGTTNYRLFHGWSAGIYHSYDLESQTLFAGTGEAYKPQKFIPIVMNVAGGGECTSIGDGANANASCLINPTDMTTDSAGNLYIADADAGVIRKVDTNGIITRIAGNGGLGALIEGENGPATEANIGKPASIRVHEKNIYFADSENSLIRKIDKDGIVSTFAGTISGTGISGDGAAASQTVLVNPSSLAIAKDGAVYFVEKNTNKIRRVGANGIVNTVLTSERLNSIALDKNDNLYYTSGWRVYVFEANNNASRAIAGSNGPGFAPQYEDYMPAIPSEMEPMALATDIEGQIYFFDNLDKTIKTVNQSGQVLILAGQRFQTGFGGNNGVAREAKFLNPNSLWIDAYGNLFIADSGNSRVRKVGTSLPTSFPAAIASVDGSEVFYFNTQGQHFQTKRADTGAIKYNFLHDSEKNLVQITNAFNKATTINRDAAGRMTSISGPYGQTYQLGLNSGNLISSVTDPLSNTTTIEYTSPTSGLISIFTKPNNNATAYEYDGLGRIVKATQPNQGITTFVFNPVDNSVLVSKEGNPFSSFRVSRDVNDKLTSITSMNLSGVGTFDKIQDIRKGISITRIPQTGHPEPVIRNTSITIETHSKADARFAGQSGYVSYQKTTYPFLVWPNNGVHEINYHRSYLSNSDGINFIKSETTTDNTGYSETTTFNSAARTISSVTSLGKTTNVAIDEHERPVQVQVGNQTLPINYSYDSDGRLKNIEQGNRITVLNYDSSGFLSEIIDPANRSTIFTNDITGKVLKARTPDAEETSFRYDANSNLTGITPPQRSIFEFVINSIDKVSGFISPGAPAKTFTYDLEGRIKSIRSESQRNTQMTYATGTDQLSALTSDDLGIFPRYGLGGKLKSVEIWGPGYQFVNQYNWYGDLLISKADGLTTARSYTYNLQGLLPASESFYFGTINYSFNADKLLTQVGDLAISRDNSTGLVTQKTLSNSTELISYSEYGEVSTREYRFNGSTFYKEVYTRDKLGRITNKQITKGASVKNLGYEYDFKGRLIKAFEDGVLKNSYTYDAQGNRLSKNDNYTATYDGRDRLTSFTKDNVQTTFTYSEDGTTIVQAKPGDSVTYTVSLLGPLMEARIQSSTRHNYTHKYFMDGEMQRVRKEYWDFAVTGNPMRATYSYDKDNRLIGESFAFGALVYVSRFIYATQNHSPDYMISNRGGTVKNYFFIKDQLGSILAVVDENGSAMQEIQYDEFGQILSNSNPGFQPFGFAGGLYDSDTGLTRFGARDYDAETGRWIERDPILFKGGSLNLYSYCGNDPVNCIDPSGLTTTVIITRDYGFGTHAALHITNGSNPMLFDPSGSYMSGQRGSGDYFGGSEANLGNYVSYQQGLGSNVEQYIINTTPAQEAAIARQIENYGGGGFLGCALGVSNVLGGCGITPTSFPGNLGNQVKDKGGQCSK